MSVMLYTKILVACPICFLSSYMRLRVVSSLNNLVAVLSLQFNISWTSFLEIYTYTSSFSLQNLFLIDSFNLSSIKAYNSLALLDSLLLYGSLYKIKMERSYI